MRRVVPPLWRNVRNAKGRLSFQSGPSPCMPYGITCFRWDQVCWSLHSPSHWEIAFSCHLGLLCDSLSRFGYRNHPTSSIIADAKRDDKSDSLVYMVDNLMICTKSLTRKKSAIEIPVSLQTERSRCSRRWPGSESTFRTRNLRKIICNVGFT